MATEKKSLQQLIAAQSELQKQIETARNNEIENVKKTIADKSVEFGYGEDVSSFLSFLGYSVGKVKTKAKARTKPAAPSVRLNDIQKEEIRTKFKAGVKTPEIRKEYGISYSTANNLRKEAGK